MYDVDELRIRLIINGPNMEELPVEVEVAQKTINDVYDIVGLFRNET